MLYSENQIESHKKEDLTAITRYAPALFSFLLQLFTLMCYNKDVALTKQEHPDFYHFFYKQRR